LANSRSSLRIDNTLQVPVDIMAGSRQLLRVEPGASRNMNRTMACDLSPLTAVLLTGADEASPQKLPAVTVGCADGEWIVGQ
jgi:hypothetical protein